MDSVGKRRYREKLDMLHLDIDPYLTTPDVWIGSPESWPDVTYLLFSPSPCTKDDLKAYKSTEAWKYVTSGYVSGIKLLKIMFGYSQGQPYFLHPTHLFVFLLCDVVAESCRLAHLSVKVEAGNNLTPDHSHTRPADVLIQNWSRGRPATFYICVTSPLNTLTLSEAGVCAGAAAQAGEVRKHSADDDKCGDLGWFCVPLVTETYGAWGPEAMACFSQLASRLSIRLQKPKSVILLYGRLNTSRSLCCYGHIK
ncbi:hypothetical protein EMCRGX_G028044 [Ephydatia muelleri]